MVADAGVGGGSTKTPPTQIRTQGTTLVIHNIVCSCLLVLTNATVEPRAKH